MVRYVPARGREAVLNPPRRTVASGSHKASGSGTIHNLSDVYRRGATKPLLRPLPISSGPPRWKGPACIDDPWNQSLSQPEPR